MLTLPENEGYYVYILRCNNDSLYTGWTTNLRKRFDAHVQGKGARYTKAHPPIACVYYERFMDKCSAMKREYEIKQLSRNQKEALIETSINLKEGKMVITSDNLYEHYFLKAELMQFCKVHQLPTSGSKEFLLKKIAYFFETGNVLPLPKQQHKKVQRMDEITLTSIIEYPFVCSQQHREFFAQQIGSSFSFKVAFQTWLKTNSGKTYQEAVHAYYELMEKQKQQPTKIDKQFEYNTYIRAFFEDNKKASLQDAIACWKFKKSLPGSHAYEKSDVQVLVHKNKNG